MIDQLTCVSPLCPSDSVLRYYTRHSNLVCTPQESDDETIRDREEACEMLYEPPYEFNYWGVVSALNKVSIDENVTTHEQRPTSSRPALSQAASSSVTPSSLSAPSTNLLRPTFQRDRSLSSTSTATISSISSNNTTTRHNNSINSIFESPTPQSFLSPLDRITSIAMSSMILDPPTPPAPKKERKSRRG